MKHITISIPENFYNTFIEFFKHIPEAKIESEESFSIPEWHKTETLKRIKNAKPENFIPWEKVKKNIRYKVSK
ncbi:MAG: addiction module protein [Bacteroidetes bacterium]|nr:addiction module protein [Bacteroidota bacterium]